ncbi:hypothetical protein CFP56_023324 [Quercus suber]|uniref:Uncharacterized protein n=1 Tax=Quercus suber TaxID=58331 RepID=A0AAW0K8P5_QUESU
MQPIVHPQNLTFQQQQLDRIRRRQPSTPRPVMDVEKDRPMVQVKIENPSELPMDGNSFNAINARHHPQMQLRAQQIAAMSNLHPQTGTQFRQMTSLQIPQVQTQKDDFIGLRTKVTFFKLYTQVKFTEHVKDGSENLVQQTQQLQGIQSQLQSLQHNSLRIAHQMPRQIHPQMQPIVHPQNLTFQQQQLDRIRRRQPSTPRPVMDVEKDRPMVQVKIENPSELPMDGNSFNAINARHHPQMQLRAQQIAAMSNLHPQTGTQFRQMTSLQIPQVQTQSMGIVRAPPVKVEGFQELMGGDAISKHDADENRLMSPSNSIKGRFCVGSRYGESEIDNVSQRFRNEELSETWYNQFIEKYRVSKPYRLSSGDHESDKQHVKDGSKNLVQQTQQLQGIQSQLQSLQHNSLRIAQQMQPIVHPQNLTFQQQPQQQQQLDRIRRRQRSASRPVMDVEKDRPMVQVKIENPSELPMDGNSFNTINARHHPQMQLRAQQIAAMSNLHAQTGTQFRQMTSLQIPQVQTQ